MERKKSTVSIISSTIAASAPSGGCYIDPNLPAKLVWDLGSMGLIVLLIVNGPTVAPWNHSPKGSPQKAKHFLSEKCSKGHLSFEGVLRV